MSRSACASGADRASSLFALRGIRAQIAAGARGRRSTDRRRSYSAAIGIFQERTMGPVSEGLVLIAIDGPDASRRTGPKGLHARQRPILTMTCLRPPLVAVRQGEHHVVGSLRFDGR